MTAAVTADTVPNLRPVAPGPPPVRRKPTRGQRRAWAGLLLGTAVLHLWNVSSAGWADVYHAGAVQAMTQNWTAFLFGSTDAGNVVTVETPRGSLWVMALSARVFGFSSWSVLAPQVLAAVGAVGLLHAAVRRVAGPGAGLLAGAALALTPATVAVFGANDPEALLVLLLVAAAGATVRAIEAARTRWMLVAGVLVGFAFLTGTGQAFVPLPALALAYLVAAPTGLWRRVRQLLAAAVAAVVAGGWWYALVELSPAGGRPYIGGSRTDSALELATAQDPLGRVFDGEVELLPLLDVRNVLLVGWLLPAASALLVVGLLVTCRTPRTAAARASLLLWGGWTVLTALVLAESGGGERASSTAALAPGVAAVVGIGSGLLWERRARWAGRATLTLLVAGTAGWAWILLDRAPDHLRWIIVAVVVVVLAAVLVGQAARRAGPAAVAATLGLMALAGPAAYTVQTAASGFEPPGGPDPPRPELVDLLRSTGRMWSAATVGAENGAALALASDTTVLGIGGRSGDDPAPTLEEFQALVAASQVRWFVDTAAAPGPGSEIAAWVRASFAATAVGGRTVYDLDRPLP